MILLRMIWVQLRDFQPEFQLKTAIGLEKVFQESEGCQWEVPTRELPLMPLIKTSLRRSPQLVSPGFKAFASWACRGGRFVTQPFLVYNHNVLTLTVFCAVLATRLITGGWILPLIIGVVLFSRGRFLASIGEISPLVVINGCLVIYMVALTHFLRTGWRHWLWLLPILCFAIGLVEPALYLAGFTIPVVVMIWLLLRPNHSRLRDDQAAPHEPFSVIGFWERMRKGLGLTRYVLYNAGALRQEPRFFSPLSMPLSAWIFYQRRYLFYGLLGLLGGFLGLYIMAKQTEIVSFAFTEIPVYSFHRPDWGTLASWFGMLWQPMDLDLICAGVLIALGALSSRSRGVPGFPDVCWGVIVLFVLVAIGGLILDLTDTMYIKELGALFVWAPNPRGPQILYWFEPLLLSLGVVGILNVVKVVDSFLPGKKQW